MHQPDFHVVGEDDGEVHRIDAQGYQRRGEHRQHQQQGRRDLEKTAEHQQQHVDREQELPGAKAMRRNKAHEGGGDARLGHPMAKGQGAGDDQHDRPGAPHRLGHDRQCFAWAKAAIEKKADEQRHHRRDRRRLGHCHDAAIDPDEHHHRHQQGGQRGPRHAKAHRPRKRRFDGEIVAPGGEPDPAEKRRRLQNSG